MQLNLNRNSQSHSCFSRGK